MKITFIGGGSLRLIPILRGVLLECPQVFEDAELRFFDLDKLPENIMPTQIGYIKRFVEELIKE